MRQGRFCLSDDSHGIHHVALNYNPVLDFLDVAGITVVHYLTHEPDAQDAAPDSRFPNMRIYAISVEELKNERFWELTSNSQAGGKGPATQ